MQVTVLRAATRRSRDFVDVETGRRACLLTGNQIAGALEAALRLAPDRADDPADLVSRYGRKVPGPSPRPRSSAPGAGSSAGST